MTLTENKNLPIGLDTNALQQLTSDLNEQQLVWLSGYFFGISQAQNKAMPSINGNGNGHAVTAIPSVSAAQVTQSLNHKVTILYGSQSGNSKKAANQTADALKAAGSEVVVADMSEYKPSQLKNEKLILAIVATYGEGEPPAAAEELHKFIFSSRAPKLPDTQFAVLALGDKSYVQFCQTGIDFDQQLEKLGAKRLAERVDCDVDWHDDADRWIKSVVSVVSKQATGGSSNGSQNGQMKATLSPVSSILSPKYDRKNPFEAEVLEKIQLNGRGSVKETWHVELSLADSGLTYQAGDALHIIPTNSERIVSDVLKASNLDPSVLVTFEPATTRNFENGSQAKPLQLTFGEYLLEQAELTVLSREFMQRYYDFSKNEKLKAILDDPKAVQNYIYGRDVADLIVEFPANLDPQILANILRKLPSRAYSIASSLAAREEEVHLTVGAVRYASQGRKKEGVASSFLADRVALGEKVKIFVEENEYFKLPKDNSAPIIMVGPGTGIAPFRAFVEERDAMGADGKNWLFFGNPNFTTDFLYQTEWQSYMKSGALNRLDLAFSRDQEQKIYVQHKLLQKSKEIFDWIQNGAYFYVCGDKNRMAKDVEQALIQIAKKEGGFSDEKAVDCVKDLKKQRRYLEDVY
jgi:sulfite reductase (NADPH) flavoprotein alpha-component